MNVSKIVREVCQRTSNRREMKRFGDTLVHLLWNLPAATRLRYGKKPFCTAPFTSLLIDPNKGVRLCCSFDGQLGNLGQNTLKEIMESNGWADIQLKTLNGEIPGGCMSCYGREKVTGWTDRKTFLHNLPALTGSWKKGLTEIEVNSTNLCNLACMHCSAEYSSRWVALIGKLEKEGVSHYRRSGLETFYPDPGNVVENISKLDLRYLEIVRFKGGEPMLNPDVKAVLRLLKDMGILRDLEVAFVTNGSVIDEEVLALLRCAGRVKVSVSVDGTGELQRYIRHGDSGLENIEQFIEAFSTLQHIGFVGCCSVMVYNVFNLDSVADWWNGLHARFGAKITRPLFFLYVLDPRILAVTILQDPTRAKLIKKYRSLRNADYSNVIWSLEQPFAGVELHNDFVHYTSSMDKIWKTNVCSIVSELEIEMSLLRSF